MNHYTGYGFFLSEMGSQWEVLSKRNGVIGLRMFFVNSSGCLLRIARGWGWPAGLEGCCVHYSSGKGGRWRGVGEAREHFDLQRR